MRTFFALACLVAAAAAAPQLSVDSEYLPPNPAPAYRKKTSSCVPKPDVYKTQFVTVPVNKVVQRTSQVVVSETKYVTRTQVVPSVIIRKVVNTQIVPVTEIKQVVSTEIKILYKTLTKRGPDQVIQKTVIRNVPVVKTQFVTITKVVTQTVQKVDVKVIRTTQIVQKTVQVPDISTRTKTEQRQLPDTTRTEVKYVTNTQYRTETLPAKIVVRTVTKTEIKKETQTRQQPARTVTVDRTQVKTVTKQVVRTEFVPQEVTKVQTNYKTRTEVKYVNREVVVPVTKVEQRVISVTNYKTAIRERVVTQTKYLTETLTKVQQLPGRTVINTQVKYVVRTELIPGATSKVVQNRTNVRTVTKVATVVKDQINTVFRTNVVKETCGGYNYKSPPNPLVF